MFLQLKQLYIYFIFYIGIVTDNITYCRQLFSFQKKTQGIKNIATLLNFMNNYIKKVFVTQIIYYVLFHD